MARSFTKCLLSALLVSTARHFPPVAQPAPLVLAEPASVLICQHAASSVIDMPANTLFNSVTIAVSQPYLRRLFGEVDHPLIVSILTTSDTFAFKKASPSLIA